MSKLPKLDITAGVGVKVLLVRDDYSILETKTRSEPFMVNGFWLVKCEGVSGGYMLDRVSRMSND